VKPKVWLAIALPSIIVASVLAVASVTLSHRTEILINTYAYSSTDARCKMVGSADPYKENVPGRIQLKYGQQVAIIGSEKAHCPPSSHAIQENLLRIGVFDPVRKRYVRVLVTPEAVGNPGLDFSWNSILDRAWNDYSSKH
jgi:hypothetical protein